MTDDRLRWSPGAALQLQRVSRARLHAYVEGSTVDPYIFGAICQRETSGPFDYRLVQAHEIPGSEMHRGKKGLLHEYDRLRRKKTLSWTDGTHSTTTIFFLDKDIDDVLHTARRSPHVVYTQTYDVEGLLFRYGDLHRAIAAVYSLNPGVVIGSFPAAGDWVESAAQRWREWLSLCIAAALLGGHSKCGYGRSSAVNRGSSSTEPLAAVCFAADLLQAKGDTPAKRALLQRGLNIVDRRLRSRRGYEVFKGKWLPTLLAHDVLERVPGATPVNGLRDRIRDALAMGMNFDDPWAMHFRNRVQTLLAELPPP